MEDHSGKAVEVLRDIEICVVQGIDRDSAVA
jgi:hypothetical protein